MPLPRYANLSYHAPIFAEAMERHLASNAADPTSEKWLTLIVHPDEVIPRTEPNPLYAFSLDEVERNLDYLRMKLLQSGFRVNYLTVGEASGPFSR
jgi:hypothetical protein